MKTILKITVLCLSLLIVSCSSDDDNLSPNVPQGEFDQGFYVLNEGGIGSVTYISDDFSRIEQNIFSSVNDGQDLGQFVQSLFFDNNNRAYIIANGSNLITVVDRFTFEKLGEITTDLDIPRYGVVLDNKAYVTNQASFTTGEDDFVAVINLDTFEVESTIPIGETVEFIKSSNDKLFVQNAAFGFGNKISVIDPNTNAVETQIQTQSGLQNIEVNNNSLYALHSSGLDIYDLNNLNPTSTLALPESLSGAKNLQIFSDEVYYTFETSVYKSNLTDTTLSDEVLFSYESSSEFGSMYGFKVHEGQIYLSDAGDFASDGFIEIYDTEGNFVFETTVGLAPNGFYFN
ncbi:YncE family protein [Flavobacteriaceae bacterium 14752]|uniref:YncE family protein n=1 Tax=Mesohalobacter salilacus TaxID=2491711 RepID=UPI000F63E0F8|nr:cell surface protein [Flavobacteriaceae bacterium 14752]